MGNFSDLLPLLVPIILLELTLKGVALRDLIRREQTSPPRWVWALIILFVSTIGPISYLLLGREE
jgi:hypothetical protein